MKQVKETKNKTKSLSIIYIHLKLNSSTQFWRKARALRMASNKESSPSRDTSLH